MTPKQANCLVTSSMKLGGRTTMSNENCSETYAVLRVIGKNVGSASVTQVIGLEPTISVEVGDIRPAGTRPRIEGIWTHSTQGFVDSTDLADHLAWLIERVPRDARAKLPCDCRFEIQCVWRSATGHGGPILSASLLEALSVRSLDLDFDIYFDE